MNDDDLWVSAVMTRCMAAVAAMQKIRFSNSWAPALSHEVPRDLDLPGAEAV